MEIYGSGPMASRIADSQHLSRVPCLRMEDVLSHHGINALDFFSLDVEGSELDVLRTMNFQKVPTFVILIEMRPVDEESNPAIRQHLHNAGFCLFASDVGHSNEVWINPNYRKVKKRNMHHRKWISRDIGVESSTEKELVCEDFLGMHSVRWLLQPQHHEYERLECSVHLGIRPASHVPYMGTTCEPWMTKCAISALARILRPSMHGLEWSCGSSTLWFLQRVASMTSIEHDSVFFRMCEEKVARLGPDTAKKWRGHLVPQVESNTTSINSTTDRRVSFEAYINRPLELERRMFDLIVVDGREREACIKLVLSDSLIRHQDGVLVLDNSERSSYDAAVELIPKYWHRYDFKTPVDRTTIWITQQNYA